MSCVDIFWHYLPEEAEKCAEWAFGPDFKEGYLEPVERWNKIHSDIFLIRYDGKPEEDVPKMIQAWREACTSTEKETK